MYIKSAELICGKTKHFFYILITKRHSVCNTVKDIGSMIIWSRSSFHIHRKHPENKFISNHPWTLSAFHIRHNDWFDLWWHGVKARVTLVARPCDRPHPAYRGSDETEPAREPYWFREPTNEEVPRSSGDGDVTATQHALRMRLERARRLGWEAVELKSSRGTNAVPTYFDHRSNCEQWRNCGEAKKALFYICVIKSLL